MENKIKVLELFAGIRATSEALNRVGIDHETTTIEFDKKVQDVANKLWGTDEPTRDIRRESFSRKLQQGDYDLVVGGFPCQPFSHAGKGQGFNDERGRGTLYLDTLRVIKKVRPKYVILENVKGILSKDHKWIVEEIEAKLKRMGYYTHTQLINAKNYIPQNRERVFIIASLEKQPEPIKEATHNFIVRDFLEEDKEVGVEYFITQQQIENLKLDINKLEIKDAKKIISVGNCSASDHRALEIYSVKGIIPTFRSSNGVSVKIIYTNKDYYGADKLEKIYNWKSQERPLKKVAHTHTHNKDNNNQNSAGHCVTTTGNGGQPRQIWEFSNIHSIIQKTQLHSMSDRE